MTLTINFPPQTEAMLNAEAVQQGLPLDELIVRIVDERLHTAPVTAPPPAIDAENAAAIAMIDKRLAEQATDDPEEIRKTEEDLAELKRNMNANRAATGERLVFP